MSVCNFATIDKAQCQPKGFIVNTVTVTVAAFITPSSIYQRQSVSHISFKPSLLHFTMFNEILAWLLQKKGTLPTDGVRII